MAALDRMIAAPPPEKVTLETSRNLHAGAAAAGNPASSAAVFGPKAVTVERPAAPKDALDEAAELFKVIFKGDILP